MVFGTADTEDFRGLCSGCLQGGVKRFGGT